MFAPLPDKPDHPALELEILRALGAEGTFEQLRDRNRGGPRWSFIDGPVTANKSSLGVHTAWGRTLKDVFQRYKALRGFDQRYQNGFDCQGLWIEVGVERELGLNSKREIEEYGLEEFARRCRDVVVSSSEALTRGSIRLGQWMDWGNDYFTFSDTNIEYIWKFLKIVDERGWLYMGHRSTEWCPRCGTSLSQHELTQSGVYQDRADPSLYRPLPAARPAQASSSSSGRRRRGRCPRTSPPRSIPTRSTGGARTASGSPSSSSPTRRSSSGCAGSELVGWRYRGPFDDLAPGAAVEHRVDPVGGRDDGPGHRHRPHRAGLRRRGLRARRSVHGLAVLTPVDEAGRFYDDYGWLHGLSTTEAADQIVGDLGETRLPRRGRASTRTATRTAGAATRR